MKFTWEGKRFLFATFLIAVTAVNTGNNLIYLIFSLMLSIIFLAALFLRVNLSGLSLRASTDHPVFAGEQTCILFKIRNSKKILPSYSVYLTAQNASSPVYCSLIAPKSSKIKKIEITFKKRGIYSYGIFSVRSGFPFIVFEKQAPIPVSGEVLVYPALVNIDKFITDLSGQNDNGSGRPACSGNEIHSIREFRYGDDRRNIHWKATAKASNLMVKEFSLADTRNATIIIDNLLPEEGEVFEKIISAAASAARYFIDAGYLVRVLSCKKTVSFGSGGEHLLNILDMLALIHEEDAVEFPMTQGIEGCTILLLKSGSSGFSRYIPISDKVIYAESL
jgi:uncharacterized protein (DUF58 family)